MFYISITLSIKVCPSFYAIMYHVSGTKMGDSDSGIRVGTGSQFYQFGAGINFFPILEKGHRIGFEGVW